MSAALATWLAACAHAAPAPPSPVARVDTVTVTRVDTVRAAATENPEVQDRLARLQIQLLEQDVEVRGLQEELSSTRLELVRTMARLQTQTSRAEAASSIAEAEIALGTLGEAIGGTALPELTRAKDYFDLSSAEFDRGNYAGALYLATQVRAQVRSGQARLRPRGEGSLLAGETLFTVPVLLRTSARTNVRTGPGTTFGVAFTLDASAPVVGQSHTSQWVRVVDDRNREGWVFGTLVTSR